MVTNTMQPHAGTTSSGPGAESASAEIMRRLYWEGMDLRKQQIRDAHKDTFCWVFDARCWVAYEEEASSLRKWLKSGTGIYWVSGKSGSGKSTFMKFVRQHPTTSQLLSAWSSPRSCICLDFFIWNPGTPLHKSREGLLRSLLYQILAVAPELAAIAFPAEAIPSMSALDQPPQAEFLDATQLLKAFSRISTCRELRTNFCIFVDGLDEYGGDRMELADLLKQMSRGSSRTKLCVSSRPWVTFEDAFHSSPKLTLQYLTHGDIWNLAQSSLQTHPFAQELSQTDAKAWEDIVDELTLLVSGVFGRVDLTVRSIRRGLDQGDTVEELKGRLGTALSSPEAGFRMIINSVDPFHRGEMLQFLCMAAQASEPLPWMLYYRFPDEEHAALDALNPKALRAAPVPADQIQTMYEIVQRRISSRCQGLLEMSLGPSDQVTYFSPRVKPSRKRVRNFFQQEDIQRILRHSFGSVDFSPGRAIHEGYLRFILALPFELDGVSEPLRDTLVDAVQYSDEEDRAEGKVENRAVNMTFEAVKVVAKNSDSRRENLLRQAVTFAVAQLRASGKTVALEETWESGGWREEFELWPEPNRPVVPTEPLPRAGTQDEFEPCDQASQHLQAAVIPPTSPVRVAVLDAGQFVTDTGHDSKGPSATEAKSYPVMAEMVTSDPRQDSEDTSSEGSEGPEADWAENTSSINPGYAESIFSRGMSNTTTLSDPASDYVKPAREILVEFFLEDVELYPLLTSATADSNIGINRLSRNFSRLLDTYSLDLLGAATTTLQREAAKFVRASSPYVTRALEARLDSYSTSSERRSDPGQATELRLVVEQRVNAFLEALQNPENSVPDSTLTPNKEDHSQRTEDAKDEGAEPVDEAFDEDSIVNALTQVKHFLGTGIPIRNLRKGLRRFVLPSSGDAGHTGVPGNLAPTQHQSPQPKDAGDVNTLQACVLEFHSLPELIDRLFDRLGIMREPPLGKGLKRARWKCRCGAKLFDDFTELVPGSIQELEAQLSSENDARQKGFIGAVGKLLGSALNSLLTWIAGQLPRQLKPSNMSSGSIIPMHSVGQSTNVAPPGDDTTHLLLCIDIGTKTTLDQKRIEQVSTDRELFFFLRELYCDYRMPKTWFTLRSIRSLSMSNFTVDFSNSVDAGEHYTDCNGGCVCLPPEAQIGPEYECDPAPRAKPKKSPPIGKNRLTHYFRDPDCIDATQTTIYDQLPKRICGELKASAKQEAEGWGIHFEEGWHWRTIYVVTAVFLFSFSFVFGIIWSVTRSDIQGAYAVSGFWLSFGSILLGFLAMRSQ